MSESMRMWVEILFDVSYLITVWVLVILMIRRFPGVAEKDKPIAKRIIWAFALLALGDTGHVGFRVTAYLTGGLAAHPELVGLGALFTAYTVTIFYMLMVDIWHLRFNKPFGWFGWFLLAAGAVRMIVMAFPQNQWGQIIPPYDWSLFRNAFLVIQGLGVMYLILRDSIRAKDKPFMWIGIMIALSYAFYTPVILWSASVPMLGMLMIPKTCAYLGVAFIAYFSLFRPQKSELTELQQSG